MGIGSIGPGSLLLILLIVVLLFGSKRLRSLGGDLGAGLRSLQRAMRGSAAADDDERDVAGKDK